MLALWWTPWLGLANELGRTQHAASKDGQPPRLSPI